MTGTEPKQRRCRTCNASIIWQPREGKKPVPLNPVPTRDGNWIINDQGLAVYLNARAAALQNPESLKYVCHFATCPDAKRWRKGDRRAGAGGRGDPARDPGKMATLIREQAERIARDPQPRAVAYICLSASAVVLLNLGVSVEQLKATIDAVADNAPGRAT